MKTKHYQLTLITATLAAASISNATFFSYNNPTGLEVSSREGSDHNASFINSGGMSQMLSASFGSNYLAFGVVGVGKMTQSDSSGMSGNWVGNFTPGEKLFHFDRPTLHPNSHTSSNEPNNYQETIAFYTFSQTTVSTFGLGAIGFYVQTEALGTFTAQIRVWDQSLGRFSEWFTREGVSTSQADGSAIFLGIGSTSANISAVQIRARSHSSTVYGRYAISSARFSTSPVPEPGSILSLGILSAYLVRKKRG